MTTPVTEIHNRMADYIPSTGELLIAGKNGVSNSAGINMFWGAYEPRVGAHLEGSGQRQDRASRRLWHLSRFVMEPGRAGPVAESAQPRRVRSTPRYIFNGLRFRNFLLRRHPRPDARVRRLQRWPLYPLHRLSSLCPRRKMWPASWAHTPTSQPTSSRAGFINITPTSSASCPAMFCSPRAMPVRSAAI